MVNDTVLEPDELLHLAIESSKNNDSESTLKYLKSAQELSPLSSDIQFMLGSTYADLGMFERAESSLKQAISLKADFEAAQFQLGLLYIVNNLIEQASKAWEPLETLGDENPYYLFKSGLLSLANDEFDKSIEYINKGLEANTENEPLNNNMNQILNDILASQKSDLIPNSSNTPNSSRHAQLKAYKNSED